MKAAGNPVTDLDPRHPPADGFNIAGAIRKRYHAKLGRTATVTFEDHQVAVIERTCPDPYQDLLRPRPGVWRAVIFFGGDSMELEIPLPQWK